MRGETWRSHASAHDFTVRGARVGFAYERIHSAANSSSRSRPAPSILRSPVRARRLTSASNAIASDLHPTRIPPLRLGAASNAGDARAHRAVSITAPFRRKRELAIGSPRGCLVPDKAAGLLRPVTYS